MATSSGGRGGVNGLAHLLEGAAPADIGDGFVNFLVRRLRLFGEQRRYSHDHAALAVSALRNVVGNPGLLNLVQCAVGRQPFDSGDFLVDGIAERHAAGSRRNAVDMNGAGAALGYAAAVFSAGQTGILPDRPKQRSIVGSVDLKTFSGDRQARHPVSLKSDIRV